MSLYRFLFIKSHEFALIILFFFFFGQSPWLLGSCSLTRDPTRSPAVEAQSPNHWTSEEL